MTAAKPTSPPRSRLGRWLAALAFVVGMSAARAAPTPATGPVPQGSPGNWVGSDDYPGVALRNEMTGTSGFRLTVDTAGKPTRCEITASSGFDVLDRATCTLLLARATFTPAHDRKGRPTEGTFANRIRWVLPDTGREPLSDQSGSVYLTIDRGGAITACRAKRNLPANGETGKDPPCEQVYGAAELAAIAFTIHGTSPDAAVDAEIVSAGGFSPDLLEQARAVRPDYRQLAFNMVRFTITRDGKVGTCSYVEQRGDERMAGGMCNAIRGASYDPPFAAIDKDGVANGWAIMRVLVKPAP